MRKYLVSLTVLLALSTAVSLWLTKDGAPNPLGELSPAAGAAQEGAGEAMIGGDFTLTDQHGKEVRDADFRGKLMLVYLGYTHCPDICPVSAATLSKTMELLGAEADQVVPVFISVDPARDTPAVMADYFSNFDKRFAALTGTPEQVARVAATYKAYYARTEPPEGEEDEHDHDHDAHEHHHDENADYTIDHSGYIYLMGKDGKYIRHFSYDAAAEDLAAAVREQLK